MDWRIEFTRNADKAMRKLDKGVAARVFDELDEIAKLDDINDGRLVILVVDVYGNRK